MKEGDIGGDNGNVAGKVEVGSYGITKDWKAMNINEFYKMSNGSRG
jgi:hypothetical protein